MKTLLAALALTVLPAMSFAWCGGASMEQQAISCAPGTVYDAGSETCVEQVNS